MLSLETYKKVLSELLDELPEEFFQKLNGGVVVSEELLIPDYARGNDICIMGQYQVRYGMRQIVMYKGSFDRSYPGADEAAAKAILRGILRHEFRHHLEYLGGIHGSSSLEAQDEREKRDYIARHRDMD